MPAMTRRAWIVVTALVIAAMVVGNFLGWWDWKTLIGWRALVGYIRPEEAADRKDTVLVYAAMVAGVVAAITAAVGLANLYYTRKNLEQQREQQREIEKNRAEGAAVLEAQRAQGSALQAYYEQMGKLLTEYELRTTSREDIKLLARGRTLTMLKELDANGKGNLLVFLYAAGLIDGDNPAVVLFGAELIEARLRVANLRDANLEGTYLQHVTLRGANLQHANLQFANLQFANLRHANLEDANLQFANLQRANLQRAKVTDQQLAVAASLKGAIMPNGQKYEDWLKDREGRGEDGE